MIAELRNTVSVPGQVYVPRYKSNETLEKTEASLCNNLSYYTHCTHEKQMGRRVSDGR